MAFSDLFFLLQQEGFITRSCICTGLTEVRNANIGENKGKYYTGFFQLAIGIERLIKLTLILEHMVAHNLAAPGAKSITSYRHNLDALYQSAERVASAHYPHLTGHFVLSPISSRILKFLSDFAKGARYANLDSLASGTITREPLIEWSEILKDILNSDVSNAKIKRIMSESAAWSRLMSGTTMVIAHNLDRKPLSLENALSEPRLLAEANRYVGWYIVLLIAPLKELVIELSHKASEINLKQTTAIRHIPEMSEFFSFLFVDRAYVLRKKRWP